MSWCVYLKKDGRCVEIIPHEEKSTYQFGGCPEAQLNITYNYSSLYHRYLDKENGLKWLHNKKAKDCVSRLKGAVLELGTKKDANYWKATPGNAGITLDLLLRWAELNPEARFRVSLGLL